MSMSSNPPATAAGARKARSHAIRLLGSSQRHLFDWAGPAFDLDDAKLRAREHYATALDAIFRAQGLTGADAPKTLEPASARGTVVRAQRAWRITWMAAEEASSHARATRAQLKRAFVDELLTDAVHADRVCLDAIASGATVSVGIWYTPTGKADLCAIDSMVLIGKAGITRRYGFKNTALRDAVRILVARSISAYLMTPGPTANFQGPKFEMGPGSAVLRAARRMPGNLVPRKLAAWLDAEGHQAAADRLRTSFMTRTRRTRSH